VAVCPALAASMRSLGSRPSFGAGHPLWHWISSLVCNGPLMTSPVPKEISLQLSEKPYQVPGDEPARMPVCDDPPVPLNSWPARSPAVALSPW
jgi:hypothetical protein